MADLGMQFDATQVEPNTGPPPPLPTDWYNIMITESEMKATKAGDGGYLELTLKVLDGPYAGRLAWDRLNLYNQNPVAVEIAQKTLSAICHAVGVFQVTDSQVLHGKPLMARIVEKGPSGGYDASNEIKGYAKQGEKDSKNAQGIKLEPEHGGGGKEQQAAPAQPGGGATPDFNPPWAGQQGGGDSSQPAQPETPAQPEQPQQQGGEAPTTPPWANN